MLKYLRLLLLPLNPIYAFVIFIRNKCYDWGYFKSTAFNLPIICVGNLAVGGSGKTPTTEYLVKLLSNYKVAILSRGYGRNTKGFVLANSNATAQTIGDEPLQYYHKFPQVTVAVCEDRVFGVSQLSASHDVILLDDAYQHRAIKAGFNILLFEFSKMQKSQFLLPAGNLREPMGGVKRAQAVLITKSPEALENKDREDICAKFNLEQEQQISFSYINYTTLKHVYSGENLAFNTAQEVLLLSGIANPKPLIRYVAAKVGKLQVFEYADHHAFTENEIEALVVAFKAVANPHKIIVTTEKDSQRLMANNLRDLLLDLPIYYLPITIELNTKDKTSFDQKILDYVKRTKRIS